MNINNWIYTIPIRERSEKSRVFLVTLISTDNCVKAIAKLIYSPLYGESHGPEMAWYMTLNHARNSVSIPIDTIHSIKGSGIGRVLSNLVISKVKELFPDYAVLKARLTAGDAYKENFLRRHKFYRRAGFEVCYDSNDSGSGYIFAAAVKDLKVRKDKKGIAVSALEENYTALCRQSEELAKVEANFRRYYDKSQGDIDVLKTKLAGRTKYTLIFLALLGLGAFLSSQS